MNMTGRNITRALLGAVAVSALTLALVIAFANPTANENTAVAGTNTAPSEDRFSNTGIFARIYANDTEIVGSSTRSNIGGVDVSEYTELVWAGFSASVPISATGQRTGTTRFEPFTIVKSLDKATPLLLQALNQNQTMVVEVLVFGTDADSGAERLEFQYTLTGAAIVSQRISSFTNTPNSAGEFNCTETIAIAFQTIMVTSPDGQTEYETSIGGGA